MGVSVCALTFSLRQSAFVLNMVILNICKSLVKEEDKEHNTNKKQEVLNRIMMNSITLLNINNIY